MVDVASQMLLGSGLTILSQPLMYVKVLIQVGVVALPFPAASGRAPPPRVPEGRLPGPQASSLRDAALRSWGRNSTVLGLPRVRVPSAVHPVPSPAANCHPALVTLLNLLFPFRGQRVLPDPSPRHSPRWVPPPPRARPPNPKPDILL